jgi:uncharacterized protein YkwD
MFKPAIQSALVAALLGLSLASCSQGFRADTPAGLTTSADGQLSTQATASYTLTVGQSRTITVYSGGRPTTPADVIWTSSNAAVAGVDASGTVKAVAPGSATVKVALRSNPNAYLTFAITVQAATTPTPTPTPTPAPVGGWSDFENQVLSLVNQARAVARSCGAQSYAATGPLSANTALHTAAYNHSRDMAVRNFFDHTNPDGLNPFQRMQNAGYTNFVTAGENIAGGQSTPQQVVSGWLISAGHCANIMNPSFKEIGVGYSAGGSYGHYWTQDFGAR